MNLSLLCKRSFTFTLLGILLLHGYLAAILDGRTSAIQKDTLYSFTNFEFAAGFVRLNKGFDVPSNGTVVLSINQSVPHDINLHDGGTIILNNDLFLGPDARITGSGYIKTNNYSIYFINSLQVLSSIVFSNRVTLNGYNGSILTLIAPAKLHLEHGVGDLTLQNMTFFVVDPPSTLIFPPAGFSSIVCDELDFDVYSLGSVTLTTTNIQIKNDCIFRGAGSSFKTTGTLRLTNDSSLTLDDEALLKIPSLRTDNIGAQLYIRNNSELFITTTSSIWTGSGSLKISGQATLKSDDSVVVTWNNAQVIFDLGSRLILDNTYFKLQ